jgi:hypothetical protein
MALDLHGKARLKSQYSTLDAGGQLRAASCELRARCAIIHHTGYRYRMIPDTGCRYRIQTQAKGQKARHWLVLKEIIRAAPCFLFFSACVGMVLVNNISARKI